MDKILFEIKITNSCEEIKRLEILNDILKNVGADASFEKEQSGENFLKIRYDKETIRKIKSRKAGAKSIKLKRKISIKEVEKWIDVTTAKEVAEELGVSRSTLFRRIKSREWIISNKNFSFFGEKGSAIEYRKEHSRADSRIKANGELFQRLLFCKQKQP